MNATQLLAHFDRLAEAPNAVPRLRRFILDLAVRGKLVEQDAGDEPAGELLKRIYAHKADLVNERLLKVQSAFTAVPLALQPYRLKSNWMWAFFGSIMISRDGERIPVSKEERNTRAKTYDYYGASGVIDKIDGFLFDKPLLLIGEDGANLINRSTPIAFIARGQYWVNNHAHVLDGITEDFLRYIELYVNAIDLKAYVTGTAQPKMNQAKMNSIPVAIPPEAEQHRIVAKVDELMALCDQLEAAQQERERRRDRLAAASLQRLNQPAADTTPEAQREHARFYLQHLPRLTTRPEHIKAMRQTILNLAVRGALSDSNEWSLYSQPLKIAATLQNGYAFKSEWFAKTGIRLLRNTNVSHGVIRWDELACLPIEQAEEFERFKLLEGDVVLSLDRPFIGTGTKVARVRTNDLPCLLLQRVGRFQLNLDLLTSDYLFLWIESPQFTDQIDPGRSNGIPHISSKQVECAEIFLPPLAEQHRIVAKVDELMALCDQLEAQLTTTQTDSRRLLEAVLVAALVPV
ncbi:restriction endonuclease subunit S [Rhodoferax sp.]|uniref:restriction endonuclease subunit S n=1 Tax=Rhodoferax sp. TaxID=50421 RepID=UPI0025E4DC03|nr:restriction endonuclease subunit S [Rhodoferax sp.]MCM2295693.1 restriction endonuclease subunit S [Rhodoferax sp.]